MRTARLKGMSRGVAKALADMALKARSKSRALRLKEERRKNFFESPAGLKPISLAEVEALVRERRRVTRKKFGLRVVKKWVKRVRKK